MHSKLKNGFTLIELLVTLSIASLFMGVILYDYGTFNDSLALSSAGQEMMINIRQAQVYGINVKEAGSGTGQFSSAYGIHFEKAVVDSYILFADSNPVNKTYDAGNDCGSASTECVQKFYLRNGVTISGLNTTSGCISFPAVKSMDITFLRPNPAADINFINGGGNIVCATKSDGQIILHSPKGKTLTIDVLQTGSISAI